jgi:hypothetical protein
MKGNHMTSQERINMIRDAISSVKQRMNAAFARGHNKEATTLYLDLGALEVCLTIETDLALKELEDDNILIAEFRKMQRKAS